MTELPKDFLELKNLVFSIVSTSTYADFPLITDEHSQGRDMVDNALRPGVIAAMVYEASQLCTLMCAQRLVPSVFCHAQESEFGVALMDEDKLDENKAVSASVRQSYLGTPPLIETLADLSFSTHAPMARLLMATAFHRVFDVDRERGIITPREMTIMGVDEDRELTEGEVLPYPPRELIELKEFTNMSAETWLGLIDRYGISPADDLDRIATALSRTGASPNPARQ